MSGNCIRIERLWSDIHCIELKVSAYGVDVYSSSSIYGERERNKRYIKNEIKLIKGDIVKIAVEVIVNAANTSLLGGGGIDRWSYS